jgi:NAD(P) transhydrogenase subunit alpha
MLAPLSQGPAGSDVLELLAQRNITAYSLELMPRISRAQSMDVLSSQSTVSGYKAVLVGASMLDKFFPMLMTAAGTIAPAKVLVLGAGVAGLQAIATARRLGAVVSAFDTRAVVREQVESLGAKFVAIDTADAETEGGYARQLTDEEQEAQRKMLADVVAQSDVVVTTALVPGRPAPRLILKETVERMRPGSVIVDLAGETGGNCEVGSWGQIVKHAGVSIVQPKNLAAEIPLHASHLYARNVANFLPVLLDDDGQLVPSPEDELAVGTLVTRGGSIVHPMVLERRGVSPAPAAPTQGAES